MIMYLYWGSRDELKPSLRLCRCLVVEHPGPPDCQQYDRAACPLHITSTSSSELAQGCRLHIWWTAVGLASGLTIVAWRFICSVCFLQQMLNSFLFSSLTIRMEKKHFTYIQAALLALLAAAAAPWSCPLTAPTSATSHHYIHFWSCTRSTQYNRYKLKVDLCQSGLIKVMCSLIIWIMLSIYSTFHEQCFDDFCHQCRLTARHRYPSSLLKVEPSIQRTSATTGQKLMALQ